MDENKRMEIAAFRYQLIAGVVNPATPLSPGEIGAYFREIAGMAWKPDGKRSFYKGTGHCSYRGRAAGGCGEL
jgi:hypothetical protein